MMTPHGQAPKKAVVDVHFFSAVSVETTYKFSYSQFSVSLKTSIHPIIFEKSVSIKFFESILQL